MAKKKTNDIEDLFKRLAPWMPGVQSAVPSPWNAQAPVIPQQYGQPQTLPPSPQQYKPDPALTRGNPISSPLGFPKDVRTADSGFFADGTGFGQYKGWKKTPSGDTVPLHQPQGAQMNRFIPGPPQTAFTPPVLSPEQEQQRREFMMSQMPPKDPNAINQPIPDMAILNRQPEQPIFRDEISQGNNGAPGMWNETTGQINPTKPVDPRLEQSGTGKMQPSSWGQKIQPIQEDWNGNLITVGKDYTGEWLSSKDGKITKYGTRAEAVAAGGDYYQPNFIYHPTQQGQGNYQQKFQEPYRQQPRQPMGSSGPIPVNPLG